ncbi:MAG: hypothetical protein IPG04_14655 [Polyangiaceae bacterium]|nr:hypothetical protein [Polyangiaceae bacterium]
MAESAPLGDMEDSEVEFAGVRAGNVCSEAYRLAASGAMTPTRHEQYRETLRSFLEGHQLMSYLITSTQWSMLGSAGGPSRVRTPP